MHVYFDGCDQSGGIRRKNCCCKYKTATHIKRRRSHCGSGDKKVWLTVLHLFRGRVHMTIIIMIEIIFFYL